MAASLSVATTAISSAEVTTVHSGLLVMDVKQILFVEFEKEFTLPWMY
jgi:hypothetical protein